MNIQKARRYKFFIYAIALVSSILFAIGIIALMCHFKNEGPIQTEYIYIVLIVVYSILPITYIFTLWKLTKSMKNLQEQDAIHTERKSVLLQFVLFLISFITRSIWFIIDLICFNSFVSQNFVWTLFTVILYVPWNIMPITYILWCHARTYNRMINQSQTSVIDDTENMTDENTNSNHCSGEKAQNEAVCDVFCTDSDDDVEVDSASKEGEYGSETN